MLYLVKALVFAASSLLTQGASSLTRVMSRHCHPPSDLEARLSARCRQKARQQTPQHVYRHGVAKLFAPLGLRHHDLELVRAHALQSAPLPEVEGASVARDPDVTVATT